MKSTALKLIGHTQYIITVLVLLVLCLGCSSSIHTITYPELLDQLVDGTRIARLDTYGSQIITSYDRSGGNDDWGHFEGDGPKGWKIITDLKGPGIITRFWSTGSKEGTKRFRFYFDGEKTARLDVSLDEWAGIRGDQAPLPLWGYEPYCWFSFLPVPFKKRLVIMEQAPTKGEKLYYQINVSRLSKGQSVESFQASYKEKYADAIGQVREQWKTYSFLPQDNIGCLDEQKMILGDGKEIEIGHFQGPALITSLCIALRDRAVKSAVDRNRLLRDLTLRVYWNESSEASVVCPLGDFFGSFWKKVSYQSAYFGCKEEVFYTKFPMPFEQSARITLSNESKYQVSVSLSVQLKQLDQWNPHWGYFHAVWNKSPATARGRPHMICKIKGEGKYVGCILGVRSFDQTWWVLEGDETIYIDGETTPSWHGTGLEDYFNGGWYYANAIISPFHGVPYKAPFNIFQYRIHQTDPVMFNESIQMFFERGPRHSSTAEMDSVAFYYMKTPQPANTILGVSRSRYPSKTPFEQHAIMHEINNQERLGDTNGAITSIDAFIETYPTFPYNKILQQRRHNYLNPTNTLAKHEGLLGVYCNMPIFVYLDGQLVAQVNDEKGMRFKKIFLSEGRHVLVIREQARPYPWWVQVALKTYWGIIGTDGTWKVAFNPEGAWTQLNYDDSTWEERGGMWTKGPPVEPYIWLEPHAELEMQSQAQGIQPSREWPPEKGFVVYRKEFDIPPK